ncbi:methyltransferase domain-containing protein [Tautonia plasticadhaerens]|uniref:methyltransferase domain-containing protein n=1 Tax=Tautonia plasticadhaerens TaxID=2527974 RepID=UPI0018D20E19|nr:methyltransferase domain-containing protein [Tautonia plasticadhaerens]
MADATGRRRVSLTMIVRDEERDLPRCLGSVADLVDEVVVVDTGSADRSRQVAAGFGARVVEFSWVDHFAEARNAAIDHATGDWILWLDADDRLDEPNRDRLRSLIARLGDEPAGYLMRQVNSVAEAPGERVVFDRVHLFPRRPEVRWERRVHEQILPSLERLGARVIATDIAFEHEGYRDPATHRRKAERNLRLLERERSERPGDGFTLFNLAWTLHVLGRLDEAMAIWPEARARSTPTISYLRKLYSLWARDAHALGRPDEALAICREGRAALPDDDELTFLEALLLRERGDPSGAETLLNRLISGPAPSYLTAGYNPGIRGHRARHNLAEICRERGRDADAETHWRAASAEAPHFGPSWRGLAELYLAHGFHDAARQATDQLARCPGGADAAEDLRRRLGDGAGPGARDDGPPSPPPPPMRAGPGAGWARVGSGPKEATPAPSPPPAPRARGAGGGMAETGVGTAPAASLRAIPDPPGAAESLARADRELAAGRVEEAEAIYRELLDEGYLEGLMAYRLGTIADARGDFDEATRLHRLAVVADPGLAARVAPEGAPHRLAVTARAYRAEPAPACPVCGASDRETIRVVNCLAADSTPTAIDPVRRWARCLGCGHGMADPRPTPAALAEALASPPPPHLVTWNYESLRKASAVVHRLRSRRPGGRLLDVGAAGGVMAGAAAELGFEVSALEVNPAFEESIRRFGVELLRGDLLGFPFGGRRFEVVLLGDVIEHLPDPRRGLEVVASLLEPGGLAWVSTPNRDGAWARALGPRDPMWRVAEHLHFFTRSGLHRLMAEVGLAPVDYRLSGRYLGCGETTAERAGAVPSG